MSTQNIYFFEGESEENFIKSFKSRRKIIPGITRKTNFWQTTNISAVLRRLPRGKPTVAVVFDTDVIHGMNRFSSNISELSKHSKKITLLPQYRDFEDELAYACGQMRRVDLPNHLYQCSSIQNLKKRMTQDRNFAETLCLKGLVLEDMWTRSSLLNFHALNAKNIQWGIEHILIG